RAIWSRQLRNDRSLAWRAMSSKESPDIVSCVFVHPRIVPRRHEERRSAAPRGTVVRRAEHFDIREFPGAIRFPRFVMRIFFNTDFVATSQSEHEAAVTVCRQGI